MRILILALTELRLMGWGMKRYFFNTGALVLVMYLVFLGMFWGVRAIAGGSVSGDSLDSMVVGYVLWLMAMMSIQGTGGEVMNESQTGTLEQLYLSPLGADMIFLFRLINGILFNYIFVTIMLFLSMLTTGRMLTVNFPYFYGVLFLSILSLVGISFMLGGIGLIHKRIGSVYGILSFALIGMMLLPVYPFTPWALLPFVAGAHAVNSSTVHGTVFPAWWYMYIAANSLFYLFAGLAIFRVFERKAMRLNKMGQY